MRNEVDFERKLDNRVFALQRDVLMWRLASQYGFSQEEMRHGCLESLRSLRGLLMELEVFLTDGQEGGDQQLLKNGADCVR